MADLCMVRSGHTTLTHSISVGGKIIVVSAGCVEEIFVKRIYYVYKCCGVVWACMKKPKLKMCPNEYIVVGLYRNRVVD